MSSGGDNMTEQKELKRVENAMVDFYTALANDEEYLRQLKAEEEYRKEMEEEEDDDDDWQYQPIGAPTR